MYKFLKNIAGNWGRLFQFSSCTDTLTYSGVLMLLSPRGAKKIHEMEYFTFA